MSLQDKILSFLNSPFPLWENELTMHLVTEEWHSLFLCGITPNNYSTASAYFKNSKLPSNETVKIFTTNASNSIFIEYPQPEVLGTFYENTGLELLNQSEINVINGIEKIKCALEILGKVPGVLDCISHLVKCISILKQDNPEIDTSHSDPTIPFSIFVSVCENTSKISNLRVAESILHEAMHLKLTLLEKHIDLIVSNTNETFYSPWRNEQRPIRGVLHGLFVFSAVLGFYKELEFLKECSSDKSRYIANRIFEINKEFENILRFKNSNGLTSDGWLFSSMLLQ